MKEIKEQNQRLTKTKFNNLMDMLKGKIGTEEIDKILKSAELDIAAKTMRTGGGINAVGKIGPVYCPQDTFDQMDYATAYHELMKEPLSKNEIFRRMILEYYKKCRADAKANKINKKIEKRALVIAEEREEEKERKRIEKLEKSEIKFTKKPKIED